MVLGFSHTEIIVFIFTLHVYFPYIGLYLVYGRILSALGLIMNLCSNVAFCILTILAQISPRYYWCVLNVSKYWVAHFFLFLCTTCTIIIAFKNTYIVIFLCESPGAAIVLKYRLGAYSNSISGMSWKHLHDFTAFCGWLYALCSLGICSWRHIVWLRQTSFFEADIYVGYWFCIILNLSGVTRVGDPGRQLRVSPLYFFLKNLATFLVARSAVSPLFIFFSKTDDLFLLIAVTITITFFAFARVSPLSRMSPRTFFTCPTSFLHYSV